MNKGYTIDIPQSLIKLIKASKTIVAFTGAGISAESGLSTFRSPVDGLYSKYKVEDVVTPEGFKRNPRFVWEFYESRRVKVRNVEPNPGHIALAKMEKLVNEFYVITQNVDGLHQKAGCSKVIELHGNIFRNKCFLNNHYIENLPKTDEVPPRCPICGSYIRPDIVWFGELLDPENIASSEEVTRRCDVFFSIGTSSVVYPAAGLIIIAKESGATIVEINPEETEKSYLADYIFREKSGVVLPRIVEELMK
ncbi:MAG TPA: NAD-dependent deacylase [Verrucomicrobiota bacterium]|nr:NAD-dependent deacylase [Verrucomicrobiota bacterium]